MSTAQDIIDRARDDLNDPDGITWSDLDLIRYINDAQNAIIVARPDAKTSIQSISLVAGSKQSLPSDALRLIDVIRNLDSSGNPGKSISPVERRDLDAIDPKWHTRTEKDIIDHFSYDERNPKVFWVSPPAKDGIIVEAVVSKLPNDVTAATDAIDLDDSYMQPLIEYVLYRAYNKETDSMASRAEAARHLQNFSNMLGVKMAVDLKYSPTEEDELT